MRNYVKSHGLSVPPERLDLLVSAYDQAWAEVSARGGYRLPEGQLRLLKNRVAKVVVELAVTWELTDAHQIAAAAARTILPDLT